MKITDRLKLQFNKIIFSRKAEESMRTDTANASIAPLVFEQDTAYLFSQIAKFMVYTGMTTKTDTQYGTTFEHSKRNRGGIVMRTKRYATPFIDIDLQYIQNVPLTKENAVLFVAYIQVQQEGHPPVMVDSAEKLTRTLLDIAYFLDIPVVLNRPHGLNDEE